MDGAPAASGWGLCAAQLWLLGRTELVVGSHRIGGWVAQSWWLGRTELVVPSQRMCMCCGAAERPSWSEPSPLRLRKYSLKFKHIVPVPQAAAEDLGRRNRNGES
eukprot:365163-Chlamydomonas_euryale.AAC.3